MRDITIDTIISDRFLTELHKTCSTVKVGQYSLYFSTPLSPQYSKSGNLLYLDTFAVECLEGVTYFLSLQKDDRFKNITVNDIVEQNPHLGIFPLSMPVLKLSVKTILSVLEHMSVLTDITKG